MKYLLSTITSVLFLSMLSYDANAQILNRLKKKAQEAAAQKAEQKITEQVQQAAEQMVERSWNSIFGEISDDSLSGGRLPFMTNSNVTTEEAYNFSTIATMEIETVNEDGKSDPPVIMEMHFNENEMYTGTRFNSEEMKKEDGELFLIYDFKNSAMLMLMNNDKDKFSFAYDWKQALENAENMPDDQSEEEINWDEVNEWQGYTKIGQKEILGYSCDGYQSESEDETIEIWVSRDADFGMNSMFKANANAKQMKGKIPDDYPYGMMMEMTTEDLDSGEKTIMKMIDIQDDANITYTMADYPKMSFGQMTEKN